MVRYWLLVSDPTKDIQYPIAIHVAGSITDQYRVSTVKLVLVGNPAKASRPITDEDAPPCMQDIAGHAVGNAIGKLIVFEA